MGSYQFVDIKKYQPTTSDKYLFDANIWLFLLKAPSELNAIQFEYSRFMDKVMSLIDLQKKTLKTEFPKIIITALIISEVYNAYLRSSFELWKDNKIHEAITKGDLPAIEKAKALELKKDYRKDDDYLESLKIFRDDLLSYKDYFQIEDDYATEIDLIDLLNNFPANTDFNDYYYYLYSRMKNLSIITNDGDFVFSGIPIISNNPHLLNL